MKKSEKVKKEKSPEDIKWNKEIWERIYSLGQQPEKNLNQAAKFTKVSSGTIYGWESYFPRVDGLAKIAKYYGVSLDSLVFGATYEQSKLGLTDIEHTLLSGFRDLDDRDQEDILRNIAQKLEIGTKKGKDSEKTETDSSLRA